MIINNKVYYFTTSIVILSTIVYIVYFSVTENYKLLFLPLLLTFIYPLFFKPRLTAYLFLITSVNFLGLINPEDFFRLPGIFKLIDLVFIIIVLIYIFDILKCGIVFPNNIYFKKISNVILLYLAIVSIQIFLTYVRYDLPFASIIKASRSHYYIAVFYFFVRYFDSEKKLKELITFIFLCTVIQFIMTILQVTGLSFTDIKVTELSIDGSFVTRVYLPAKHWSVFSFFVSLSLLHSKSNIFNRKLLLVILFSSLSSIILSYTRTLWILIILGIIIHIALSSAETRKILIRNSLILGFLSIPILSVSHGDIIVERITSIYSEIGDESSNFSYRLLENPMRVESFLDNPIFGPGFVHSDYAANIFGFIVNEQHLSEAQIKRALMLQTNDSGLITLLVTFGLTGVVWVVFKLLIITSILIRTRNLDRNWRTVQVAVVTYIISVWLTSATTNGFLFTDGIVILTLSLFVLYFSVVVKSQESVSDKRIVLGGSKTCGI